MAEKSLTVAQITSRLKLGENFMKPYVDVDTGNCRRWLDPSVIPAFLAVDEDSDIGIVESNIQNDVPIAPANILTSGLLAKVAAISVNRPDWHVVCQDEQGENDPQSAEIVRQDMINNWDRKNWQRIAQKCLLKRCVGGLGIVSYCYSPGDGSIFEHVYPSDVRIDPFVLDWQNPKYGGKKRRISLNDAIADYPNANFNKKISKTDMGDKEKVAIEIYWDKQFEYHVYDNEIITHKSVEANKEPNANLYGRVPLLIYEGDLHPGNTPFPVGDGTLAAGAAAEHQDITQSISNTAKAGQGVLVADSALDKSVLDALESAKDNQIVKYAGADKADGRIFRVPGEELRPAVIEARRESRDSVMSLIGVSQMDMGQLMDNPHFATEVASVANKGGSRQNQARAEYETFLNRWSHIHVGLMVHFGGPYVHPQTREQMATTHDELLHNAYSRVIEIKIIESSTTYKDPAIEQQQSMQMYQQVMQSFQIWLGAAQIQAVSKIPSLEKITDRMFRAFGISNTDQMWQPAPQMPQQQGEGKPPMEMISYKDAPEDIKRQMEQQAGMQPSQMGTPSQDGAKVAIEDMKQQAENARTHAELTDNAMQRLHESTQQYRQFSHEQQLKAAELAQAKDVAKLTAQKKTQSNGKGK